MTDEETVAVQGDEKLAIHQHILQAFFEAKIKYRFAEGLDEKPKVVSLIKVNGVDIKVLVWKGALINHAGSLPTVCCRIVVTPANSKGDGVDYVTEVMVMALKAFKGTTITSDDKGEMFVW